jgi:hypothetical protein
MSIVKDFSSSTRHVFIDVLPAEIDKNIGLKLAVTPLTESRDKYLCLVLQLLPEMRTGGHQQIILKLTDVI